MARTLIVFSHPALQRSRVNRALADGVRDLDDVTFHDLYEAYPDFYIDAEREKQLLAEHERVVWQHPFYWYSTPALMKEWFDVVLQYGWAYGKGGDALASKSVRSVVTTGGTRDAYCREGYNTYSVDELLRPIEQTARLCGMSWEKPLIVYGALHLSSEDLNQAIADYRAWLTGD